MRCSGDYSTLACEISSGLDGGVDGGVGGGAAGGASAVEVCSASSPAVSYLFLRSLQKCGKSRKRTWFQVCCFLALVLIIQLSRSAVLLDMRETSKGCARHSSSGQGKVGSASQAMCRTLEDTSQSRYSTRSINSSRQGLELHHGVSTNDHSCRWESWRSGDGLSGRPRAKKRPRANWLHDCRRRRPWHYLDFRPAAWICPQKHAGTSSCCLGIQRLECNGS